MRGGLTCNSVARVDAVDSVFLFLLVPVFSQINHKKKKGCSEASKFSLLILNWFFIFAVMEWMPVEYSKTFQ